MTTGRINQVATRSEQVHQGSNIRRAHSSICKGTGQANTAPPPGRTPLPAPHHPHQPTAHSHRAHSPTFPPPASLVLRSSHPSFSPSLLVLSHPPSQHPAKPALRPCPHTSLAACSRAHHPERPHTPSSRNSLTFHRSRHASIPHKLPHPSLEHP